MADPSADIIMEEREALMVARTGGIPSRRTAHFLKPTVSSTKDLPSPLLSSKPTISHFKKPPLKVEFKGRKCPQKNWKTWVHQLQPLYQTIWKKAGIYEAILSSTYQTLRHNNLIIELAERWSSETNTFIFPWGEATITLEDMMVLGGYSVLGHPVFNLFEIEEKLIKAHREIRLGNGNNATQYAWMDHFMGSGGGLLEHQAFLCLWLSRYVLPAMSCTVIMPIFPIAIHLSKGTPVALAPTVLANIYRDLGLLKKSIVDSKCNGNCLTVTLCAPFQLVQLWAWERFPTLGPIPNAIKCGEPRLARWHRLKYLKVEDVNKAIDSAGECFLWRPYATVLNNWVFCKFYRENEEWILVESGMDKEAESYARCLRVSELVGLDCIEQYLPHRVALQFGFDLDIPGIVPRCSATTELAWNNYSRQIGGKKLYIPSRLFESDVTTRYLAWWKQCQVSWVQRDTVQWQRCAERSKRLRRTAVGKEVGVTNEIEDLPLEPSLPPKCERLEADKSTQVQTSSKDNSNENQPAGNNKHLPVNNMVVINNDERQSSSSSIFEMSDQLALEVRISKLERMIGGLKARRFSKEVCKKSY